MPRSAQGWRRGWCDGRCPLRRSRYPSHESKHPAAFAETPSPHNGMLSCFFQGVSTSLVRSMASARATRRRVECGMITSSI